MRKRLYSLGLVAAMVLAWRGFWPSAAVAQTSTLCPGNVCSATVTVGGQVVTYSWTENQNVTDASLKFRFQSGPYAANANPVKFIVNVLTAGQSFASYASLKNPGTAYALPANQVVNGAKTIIERSDASSAAGTRYDFVQDLRFGSVPAGTLSVKLEFDAYGAAVFVGPFNVYFDAVSPSNRDEGQSLTALYGSGYRQCYDSPTPVDNDLDYRTDCADADCAGKSIGASSVCEATETTCNDGLDNDGNGLVDCADPLCNGKAGNPAGTKFCGPENGGANHANCADGFDNDGNGKTDCSDNGAGTGCWKSGFQDCAKAENIPSADDITAGKTADQMCMDNIDNDRDGDFNEAVDSNAGTGVDCNDIECKGLGHCPTSERLHWDQATGTFIDTPAQCFDGIDNDLDGKKDCADPDCNGVTFGAQHCSGHEAWLPPSPLDPTGVSAPAAYFNYCSDGLDNDGDGKIDAQDSDCKDVFGECGPSPATEDYTFLSCSDGQDNDLNGLTDCADAGCRAGGKLGRSGCLNASCGAPAKYATTQTDAAACAASENAADLCGDGLDNDGNGRIDCADPACDGRRHGPTVGTAAAPYACGTESPAALTCRDGADNDSDLGADCFDAACQDGSTCAKRPGGGGWSLAGSCPTIPDTTALSPIAPGGSVRYAHDDRLYAGSPYRLRFTGSGSYTSLTIVIGDAAVPANRFPFDAGTGNCTLTGTGAAQMQYTSSASSVGVINEIAGQTLTDFDVTLGCAVSSAAPLGPQSYKLAVVANHGGIAEFGESSPSVQVYEHVAPTMPNPGIETEAILGSLSTGTVNVPVGGSVRFQAVPNTDASGICRCDFDLNGVQVSSTDGNCMATAGPFANDNNAYVISAAAVDGASNKSATSTTQTIRINVLPSVAENLTLGVDTNGATVTTFRGGDAISLATAYRTDTLSTFPAASNCRVYVYDKNWVGGQAATATMTPTVVGNTMTCQGTYAVPGSLPAGRYWMFVEATDSTGDIVRSNAQAFLKCENSDVGTGDCKDADFDHDGAPEGRFTPGAYSSPPTPTYPGAQPKACDNCVNYYNPNQSDVNANGIGDACEASLIGRCQYKYCGSAPDDPTPGAACSTDADCTAPDLCVVVNQQMCTVNCASDADCSPPTTALVGSCKLDWGVCDAPGADAGNCCFSNTDCLSGTCKSLVKPFIETMSGQIYSAGQIQAVEAPPIYNATFCLQSGGVITNFTSANGCSLSGAPTYQIPDKARNYVGSFGSIDVSGILNGKYGALSTPAQPPAMLSGGIYYYPSGLTIAAPITFQDSTAASRANGLIVVKGDLHINADLAYQDKNESDLKNLASVGWIVLKDAAGNGGNVYIDGAVSKVVGAFYAENAIDTGSGNTPLAATGAFVAKNFVFNRQYASRTAGSERVTFDARLVLNPPPGLSDAARSLPGFRSIPGQ